MLPDCCRAWFLKNYIKNILSKFCNFQETKLKKALGRFYYFINVIDESRNNDVEMTNLMTNN